MNALSLHALWSYAAESALSCLKFAAIIIPLVAIYDLLKHVHLFRKAGERLNPLAARLHLSPAAVFPLITGLFLGLTYGAGILIKEARDGAVTKRDVVVLAFLLASLHAMIEDTLLFVVIGGSAAWILIPRALMAIGMAALVGRLYPAEPKPAPLVKP